MNTLSVYAAVIVIVNGLCCKSVWAETITPLNGQTSAVIQQDISACQAQAGHSAATQSSQPSGARARGAVTGAVAGAAVGQVRGNRYEAYDRVDDDVKQEYRQNKAREGAVAGVIVGGARQRQERRNTSQNSAAASSGYSSCMQLRGYQVTP